MTQVFLNYRTVDEPLGAGMLDRILSEKFGSSAVFFASKSIELGELWEPEMFNAVRESVAVLVIMGRFWLTATDDEGVRLIDKEDDFVRREILLGIEADKKVIPVLLGTPRPKRADLPEALRPLAERQSISIAYRSTGPDIDRLVAKLREQIPQLRKPERNKPKPGPPGSVVKAGNYARVNNGSMTNINAHNFNAGQPFD